jgi:hypothetical protein
MSVVPCGRVSPNDRGEMTGKRRSMERGSTSVVAKHLFAWADLNVPVSAANGGGLLRTSVYIAIRQFKRSLQEDLK